ncbi:MAG: M28 family metallopeptidase [Candidatus Izemoplasmataceae bacterium]
MKKNETIRALRLKVFDYTRKMIKNHGPRLAGTNESIACSEEIAEILTNYADHIEKQTFKVHKGAFLGWIRILVFFYIVSLGFIWFNLPYVAYILTGISIVLLILQFILYLPIIDWLYPKKPAQNIIGTIEPANEAKQTIIISGHHDSARIFNFFVHQPSLYNLRVTGSIFMVVTMLVLSILLNVFPDLGPFALLFKIILSAGALLVVQMWFFASKKGTPGAGDNLIATNIALVLGEYFKENPLNHTRIKVVSFDAEEEGLRGARYFAKHTDLTKLPTILLNADCIYDEKELFFLTSDINNTVKLSETLAKDLQKTAKALDIKTTVKPIAILTGGTDAAEIAKKNVRATTLIGMPWSNDSRSNVYHTPNDLPEAVSKKAVEAALAIFKTYIEERDQALKTG